MSSGKELFYKSVDEGREGHNIGLSTGSTKLDLYTDGFLPGTSYLIGGKSGAGKSTYALWSLVYQPLIHYLKGDCQERDPYWKYFSLEMTQPQVYAKLVSMYVFDNFGVTLRFKDIMSRGKDCILSDENYEILLKCDKFLDILDQRLDFYEGSLNENKYLSEMNDFLKRFGTFEDDKYIPNNSLQVLGVVIDHMSLVNPSNGRTKKDEMDAISKDSVRLRNATGIVSPIHIAQFNRNSGNQERMKQGLQDPSTEDYKDTNALVEDSQVIMAVFSPHNYKLATYKKYNIKILEQSFIGLFLLKSRFGTSDIMIPMNFLGDISHYVEMPKPEDIYDWEKYTTPNYLLDEDNSIEIKDEKEEKDGTQINNYSFIL